MYNVQMYNVQKDNVLNMSAVLGVILTFFWRHPKKKKVRYLVRPLRKTPSDQFQALPFALWIPFSVCFDDIKTALVSIIFILELSVLDKSFLEMNFQAKGIISRVPCTPVFLRLRTSGFQY